MEKLIGSVLCYCVDKRRIGSNLLPVRTIPDLWHYPVHFPFLAGFWGETDGDQCQEYLLIDKGLIDEESRRVRSQ